MTNVDRYGISVKFSYVYWGLSNLNLKLVCDDVWYAFCTIDLTLLVYKRTPYES